MNADIPFPWKFYVLAFAISWLLWLPGILGGPVLTPLAVYGPTAAALLMIWREGRWTGVQEMLRRVLNWRITLRWWAVIIVVPAALMSLTVWLYRTFGGEGDIASWQMPEFLPHPLLLLPYFLFTLLFQGPLGEEPGWRGYALDRLQARRGPLAASVILGLFWGLWHLPLFLIPGSLHAESIPMLPFMFSTIPLSIVITWIYNRTGRNLLSAVLFHQFLNFGLDLNPIILTVPAGFAIMVALTTLVSIVVGFGWRTRPETPNAPR